MRIASENGTVEVPEKYKNQIRKMIANEDHEGVSKLVNEFKKGGMLKRKDGSYSKRGLWDNIRANRGSGKKPTKEMLKQERKIRNKMKGGGGTYIGADGLEHSIPFTTVWPQFKPVTNDADSSLIYNDGNMRSAYLQKTGKNLDISPVIYDKLTEAAFRRMKETGEPFRLPPGQAVWYQGDLSKLKQHGGQVTDWSPGEAVPWHHSTIGETMGKGGYTVKRSSARKGKTHVVIGPDGTKKYFGDSKLGQHPKDPARKKSFYARHAKNLKRNPYFRAFARATWDNGGKLTQNMYDLGIMPYADGGITELATNSPQGISYTRQVFTPQGDPRFYQFTSPSLDMAMKTVNYKTKYNPADSIPARNLDPYIQQRFGIKKADGGPTGMVPINVEGADFSEGSGPDAKKGELLVLNGKIIKNYVGRPPHPAEGQDPLGNDDAPEGLIVIPKNRTKEYLEAGSEKRKQIERSLVSQQQDREMKKSRQMGDGGYYSFGMGDMGMAYGGPIGNPETLRSMENWGAPSAYKKGGWIQKATASIKRRGTEGVCTGSKFGSSSCPPGSRRYNLAKTFRAMAKRRKHEDGGTLGFGGSFSQSMFGNMYGEDNSGFKHEMQARGGFIDPVTGSHDVMYGNGGETIIPRDATNVSMPNRLTYPNLDRQFWNKYPIGTSWLTDENDTAKVIQRHMMFDPNDTFYDIQYSGSPRKEYSGTFGKISGTDWRGKPHTYTEKYNQYISGDVKDEILRLEKEGKRIKQAQGGKLPSGILRSRMAASGKSDADIKEYMDNYYADGGKTQMTPDSTAYYKDQAKFHSDLAVIEAQYGHRKAAEEHMAQSRQAHKDASRQQFKNKPGFDKYGNPIKRANGGILRWGYKEGGPTTHDFPYRRLRYDENSYVGGGPSFIEGPLAASYWLYGDSTDHSNSVINPYDYNPNKTDWQEGDWPFSHHDPRPGTIWPANPRNPEWARLKGLDVSSQIPLPPIVGGPSETDYIGSNPNLRFNLPSVDQAPEDSLDLPPDDPYQSRMPAEIYNDINQSKMPADIYNDIYGPGYKGYSTPSNNTPFSLMRPAAPPMNINYSGADEGYDPATDSYYDQGTGSFRPVSPNIRFTPPPVVHSPKDDLDLPPNDYVRRTKITPEKTGEQQLRELGIESPQSDLRGQRRRVERELRKYPGQENTRFGSLFGRNTGPMSDVDRALRTYSTLGTLYGLGQVGEGLLAKRKYLKALDYQTPDMAFRATRFDKTPYQQELAAQKYAMRGAAAGGIDRAGMIAAGAAGAKALGQGYMNWMNNEYLRRQAVDQANFQKNIAFNSQLRPSIDQYNAQVDATARNITRKGLSDIVDTAGSRANMLAQLQYLNKLSQI